MQDQENAEEAAESLPLDHRPLRVRQATCGDGADFFREFVNTGTGEVVLRFCGRLCWQLFEQAGVPVLEEDGGRRYIDDPGDMRVAMSKWIGKAYERKDGGPVGLRKFHAVARGTTAP